MQTYFIQQLRNVEHLAQVSKWGRLSHNPAKYLYAIFLKNLLYPIIHKEVTVKTNIFTGQEMNVILPAATDIYLTGGKSHFSEIKLARFLINYIKSGDTFWDIGAHYGYFSLIASKLVSETGIVVSIEASPTTFSILKSNVSSSSNVQYFHKAVSDKEELITFYELPNLYSEYNTTDVSQFEREEWFSKIKAKKVEIEALSLDSMCSKFGKNPNFIKIDVEGGEMAVIKGGRNLLQNSQLKPLIIMEYLEPSRNNEPHKNAVALLRNWGYQSYSIDKDGGLLPVSDIDAYLLQHHIESDNIVFKFD